MSVKIGSARIDENGHITGGRAGDQTGREVSTQSWYRHSKGWRVFRPKRPQAALLIAWNMQAACDNSRIGYDQSQRNTLYTASKPVGFNCALVATACETDCSALVRVCCAYAGITLPDFNTASEAQALLKSGAFTELTGSKYTDSSACLRRGDILVTKTKGHTAVVLSDGPQADAFPAGAMPSSPAASSDARVAVTGGSVWIRSGPGTDYGKLGVVHQGDVLPYAGETAEGWHLVTWQGSTAWISGKYTTLTEGR